ncbi:MAG TPA: glycosyltransferase family 2 protein [Gammaproteobacteria bacterium]|nr:glycosyltransferase family 2 protein [Gammaproteobacteria bacterium]
MQRISDGDRMERADIAVVVVNYNAGNRLYECARSVLAEPDVSELWVVDNASRDGSLQRLETEYRNDERLRVVRNDRNLGFAAANNIALRQTSAPFILLLNPDCVLRGGTIAAVRAALEARPDAGMAGCLIVNPDGSEQRGGRRHLPDLRSSFVRVLHLERWRGGRMRGFDLAGTPLPEETVEVEAISGAFMLVRRAAVEDVGLLDEGYFLHCEDLDWCIRFAQKGWRILFVPRVSVLHRQGTSSRTRPVRVLWYKHRGMWRFHRKHYAAQTPSALNALVWVGIWLRFALLAVPATVTGLMRSRYER